MVTGWETLISLHSITNDRPQSVGHRTVVASERAQNGHINPCLASLARLDTAGIPLDSVDSGPRSVGINAC